MAVFFLIGFFAALAGFLYGQWLFLAFWVILALIRFIYEVGGQWLFLALWAILALIRSIYEAQREAARQGKQ